MKTTLILLALTVVSAPVYASSPNPCVTKQVDAFLRARAELKKANLKQDFFCVDIRKFKKEDPSVSLSTDNDLSISMAFNLKSDGDDCEIISSKEIVARAKSDAESEKRRRAQYTDAPKDSASGH